ncbi:hypothetical protein, partial [Salmonella enterica]|uniref:hypothetical protein n=1 Tax=Salmonella enterica TaxID=28901 RepID=UPI001F1CC144
LLSTGGGQNQPNGIEDVMSLCPVNSTYRASRQRYKKRRIVPVVNWLIVAVSASIEVLQRSVNTHSGLTPNR